MNLVFIGAGVVIIVLLVIGLVVSINSERNQFEERLGRFLDEYYQQRGEAGQEAARSIVTDWIRETPAGSQVEQI